MLKRQMRAAVDHHEAKLLPGQWVIRLRAPFDVRLFQSAASVALRQAASSELEQLFIRAVPA
jgi:ribonuclease P protein component